MADRLFDDFDPISAKAWKQKIQVDLKGADYNKSLIHHTEEGIDIKPFYHKDTHKPIDLPVTKDWRITEKIYLENYTAVHKITTDVVNRGAESLWLIMPTPDQKIFNLLKHINQLKVPVLIECLTCDAKFLNDLDEFTAQLSIDVLLNIDPLSQLSSIGDWQTNQEEDLKLTQQLVKLKHLKPQLCVDSRLFQNAGALKQQQLSYSLGILADYFNYLETQHSLPETLQINLITAIGSNYFFEIAKLKAARILISALAKSFAIDISIKIIAEPTTRNKTLYDYNVNMLRTTTECMSAVLGSADWINNLAYDEIFHKTNEFGERISRNQLLILKHESYFDKVHNPANGSYYIEEITQQLAEKALSKFKQIEKDGGYLKLLFANRIQDDIKDSEESEAQKLDDQEFVMVGINKYQNLEDQIKNDLELYPFVKKQSRKTRFKPIITKRLAANIELKRLENERQAED